MFKYLDPSRLQVKIGPDGTLRAEIMDDRCVLRLDVVRAMPLSKPEEQIVLRDGGGNEVGVIERIDSVPEPSQGLLRESLRRRYFLPRILKINHIHERFGSSSWDVETDRGPVTIDTKAMHEALTEISPGRYLLRDSEENRYELVHLEEMDPQSRAKFLGV